jgi:hypothetical protein
MSNHRVVICEVCAGETDDSECPVCEGMFITRGRAASATPDEPNSGGNCPETLSNQGNIGGHDLVREDIMTDIIRATQRLDAGP